MTTAALEILDPGTTKDARIRVHGLASPRPRRRVPVARTHSQPIAPSTVLVAEDDADSRRLVVDALQGEGYRVIEVENGRQLAKCLADMKGKLCPRPDLVISDIRMPGHTGLDVLAALRESDWAMPVILITAFGDHQTHEEARRLGAATVLNKPFDLDDMVDAARSIVPARL